MSHRFTYQGISSEVSLTDLALTDSRLRRLRALLQRSMPGEAADHQVIEAAHAALQAAGESWVTEHHRCVLEILRSWDELATAWRAGRDRNEIEPRLARLPDDLMACLSMVPDADTQIRAALRTGLFNGMVCRLPAARPKRDDLNDLGRRLRASLDSAFVLRLKDGLVVDAALERFVEPRIARLSAEQACRDAEHETEPCGWCDVGEGQVANVLVGAGLRVVGTWACPPPKNPKEQRFRAVEGLAVAPRQGIGLWGPWSPTVHNLEARGPVCELDQESGCGCAALSADGRRAAAGGWGFVAWDLGSKRVLLAEDELEDPLHALLFHPDGSLLYTGGDDGCVRCWDLSAGGTRWTHQCDAPVKGLAMADGRLAAATAAGQLQLLDPATGNEIDRLLGAPAHANAVAATACGRRYISAGGDIRAEGPSPLGPGDDALVLWEVGPTARRVQLAGHTHSVVGVGFVAGGKQAVSASEDGTVRLWCCETGAEVGRLDLGIVRDFPTSVVTDGDRRLWIGTWGGWVVEVQVAP
jgi:PQQ-like domain